jgi:hypothetical protein
LPWLHTFITEESQHGVATGFNGPRDGVLTLTCLVSLNDSCDILGSQPPVQLPRLRRLVRRLASPNLPQRLGRFMGVPKVGIRSDYVMPPGI